jgi:hypothetical protein
MIGCKVGSLRIVLGYSNNENEAFVMDMPSFSANSYMQVELNFFRIRGHQQREEEYRGEICDDGM